MDELSRRGVLTAVASTALGGCTGLRRADGDRAKSQLSSTETVTETETVTRSENQTTSTESRSGTTPRTVASVDRNARLSPSGGWGHRFTVTSPATVSYTVESTKPGKSGFDVFLFTGNEYTDYRRALNGRIVDAQPTSKGSVRNVGDRASRTFTLSPGRYTLVVDNSVFGDGGKPRSKRPETVHVSLSVRTRPD